MDAQINSLFTMDVIALILLLAFIVIYVVVKVVGYFIYLRKCSREPEDTFEKDNR